MKTVLIFGLLVIGATVAFGTYTVEWSSSLSYSMATGYTSNKNYSYDITGDSIPELFAMDSSSLKVFNGVTHSLIWTIPMSYTYGGYPTVCNTDGDANKEIVFSAYGYSSGYSGRFYVYDCQTHNQDYISPVKNGYPSVVAADIDGDGKSEICCVSGNAGSRILEVYGSDAVVVKEGGVREVESATLAAFPNPARHFVNLMIAAGAAGDVVSILDIAGRIVRTMPLSNPRAQDPTPVLWDCCDDAGQPVVPGSYLFRCGSSAGRVEVIY
jgi:hypothetical protein